jgi:hypothetical protein
MRQGRDSAQKVGRAPTFCNQKSQEHAESRRAAFCGRPSSRSTLLQYELAQSSRIQITWVLAKVAEQLADA